MVGQHFEWEGDLTDDCTLIVGDLMGRAECMSDRHGQEVWWCAVYRGKEQLFHSGEPAGAIIGADMARKICESIIAAAMGVVPEWCI